MIVLLKLFGGIFVLGGFLYFAICMNQRREQQKKDLRKLYSILLQLKSEMQYMQYDLPDCFHKLAQNCQAPFKKWLLYIANTLNNKGDNTFCEVWMAGLELLHINSAFEVEDLEPLKELGDKLGTNDITSQLKAIDYVLLHIEQNRCQMEGELEQKKKVTVTLCLFCGAMIWILLL